MRGVCVLGLLAISCGSSQWQDVGIDPGLYARSLAAECSACYMSTRTTNPVSLLQHAFVNSATITGSSTACVLTIDDAGMLRASTVGDSVFLVFREGRPLFRQREMQVRFPRCFSPVVLTRSCSMASTFPISLEQGHAIRLTVVLGQQWSCVRVMWSWLPQTVRLLLLLHLPRPPLTAVDTGVTDNLFDEEIAALVLSGGSETEMAQRIAAFASHKANNSTADTPFARSVKKLGYDYNYNGGKLDDITVIVAFVVTEAASFARL
jgi:protein phosphatase PTC7